MAPMHAIAEDVMRRLQTQKILFLESPKHQFVGLRRDPFVGEATARCENRKTTLATKPGT